MSHRSARFKVFAVQNEASLSVRRDVISRSVLRTIREISVAPLKNVDFDPPRPRITKNHPTTSTDRRKVISLTRCCALLSPRLRLSAAPGAAVPVIPILQVEISHFHQYEPVSCQPLQLYNLFRVMKLKRIVFFHV